MSHDSSRKRGAPTGVRARLVDLWTLLHREVFRLVRRPRNPLLLFDGRWDEYGRTQGTRVVSDGGSE